ncbi:MAG: phytanoyl-CoA dioxygenase family protein [Myxococcales bacterium]|nr:phytanoyl-CoA dioxygenase family protein [Myxococcales bacterium]
MTTAIEYIREEIDTEDFSDALAAIGPLNLRQRAMVRAMTTACRLFRMSAMTRDKQTFLRKLVPPLPRNLSIGTRDTRGVDAATRAAFEATGVAGPFRLMSAEEAADLLAHCRGVLRDPQNPFLEIIRRTVPERAARMLSEEDILLGLNRFMVDPNLRAVLGDADLMETMSALMGSDDVACWRSQFFRQRSGGRTALHQNIDFLDGLKEKTTVHLRPGRVFHPNTILNAWISLTEATVHNGCLRVLAGSFADTRIYDLAWSFNKRPTDLLAALSFLPDRVIAELVTIALFSSGAHRGTTRALFKLADFFYDDLMAREVAFADFTARPGEYWVFSSFNMHGSHAFTSDAERFTLVGRYADMHTLDIETDRFEVGLEKTVRLNPDALGWQPLLRAPGVAPRVARQAA